MTDKEKIELLLSALVGVRHCVSKQMAGMIKLNHPNRVHPIEAMNDAIKAVNPELWEGIK